MTEQEWLDSSDPHPEPLPPRWCPCQGMLEPGPDPGASVSFFCEDKRP